MASNKAIEQPKRNPGRTGIGGRKKMAGEAVRKRQINFRVNNKEHAQIRQWFADSNYKTLGQFCYQVLRGANVITYTRTELSPEMQLEIKRIGNNINQIAYHLNKYKTLPIAAETYQDIQRLASHLRSLLANQQIYDTSHHGGE